MKGTIVSIELRAEPSKVTVGEEVAGAFMLGCVRLVNTFGARNGGPIEVIKITPADRARYTRSYEVKIVLRRNMRDTSSPETTEIRFEFYPHGPSHQHSAKNCGELTDKFLKFCLQEITEHGEEIDQMLNSRAKEWKTLLTPVT